MRVRNPFEEKARWKRLKGKKGGMSVVPFSGKCAASLVLMHEIFATDYKQCLFSTLSFVHGWMEKDCSRFQHGHRMA